MTYTYVDTGRNHTVLLASDGTAVACGRNTFGECNVPALSDGVIYTQVAIGGDCTFLLTSNGTVEACGWNISGHCNIPILPDGVVYEQVVAGREHTVLRKSDGTVTTCGRNDQGQCTIPTLSSMCQPHQGVTYSLSLVFFWGLASVPLTSFQLSTFPARSCPGLSYSDMFYSQVLLRRLHGSCAHVCTCICLYACVFLRPCRPCGVNLPTWLGLHPNGH